MWSGCRPASLEGYAGSLQVSGMLRFEQGASVTTRGDLEAEPVMDADLQDW